MVNAAAGMKIGFPVCVGVYPVAEALVVWLNHFCKKLGGYQSAPLCTGIVAGYPPSETVLSGGLVVKFEAFNDRLDVPSHHIVGGFLLKHQHAEPFIERALCDVVREQCA